MSDLMECRGFMEERKIGTKTGKKRETGLIESKRDHEYFYPKGRS